MKHRGPGSSLNPAREAAREAARARTPRYTPPAAAGTALTGAASPTSIEINGWSLSTDADGNLVAAAGDGLPPQVIATHPENHDPRDDEETT